MAADVDIILPTHCRPHTLGYAITAVLEQTHTAFTLHVIGDGCDDATATVVAGFGDPRVRFHRFPKARGFGYANRNRVLKATRAPYIAYATDDDLWFPDHLARGVAALEAEHVDLVAFRSAHVHPPDRLDPYFFAFDWRMPLLSVFLRNWFLGALTLVHRRSVFAETGFWNERLFRFGDRELYNRIRVSARPTAYRDEITVLRFYAQHWDTQYAALPEPPQRRYLTCIADATWRENIRAATAPGRRSMAVRMRQARDFARFALRSGPKFARFWYERWGSNASSGGTSELRRPQGRDS